MNHNVTIGHSLFCILYNPQVKFSGDKWKSKLYRWHTGYPGGLKQRRAIDMLERQPEKILKKAILGMLSRNNLRHGFMESRLKIYAGKDHPHQAQLPPSVEPLPKHPRSRRGSFHYGLGDNYASPNSYQSTFDPEKVVER